MLLFALGEVWLSQMAVTHPEPEHMEGTWKVWLLVLESHSGVSDTPFGEVCSLTECNSNRFQKLLFISLLLPCLNVECVRL